eukprot:11198376-Lingulodinium_polyedra.AAC.1
MLCTGRGAANRDTKAAWDKQAGQRIQGGWEGVSNVTHTRNKDKPQAQCTAGGQPDTPARGTGGWRVKLVA